MTSAYALTTDELYAELTETIFENVVADHEQDCKDAHGMPVCIAVAGKEIEIMGSGNRYTVLSYQDRPGKVRAQATAGKHITYLHPTNLCIYIVNH